MKRLVAMAVVLLSVIGAAGMSANPPDPVDEALVQAKIDARLHQLLTKLIEARGARAALP